MALEDVGARLITVGEAQFLGSMMKSQKAMSGFGSAVSDTHGPTNKLTTMSLALATAMGQALFNAAMAAGKAIVGFATDSIAAASDLGETTSKVGVVFGDQADALLAFGKTADTSLGMSENAALSAVGTYGNLFDAMGIGKDVNADMSMGLVTLAGDLASFNNMDPTEVLDKLRSGLSGETETLKSLGINLNQAVIEEKAREMGLLKGKDALTAAAKAQAVYALTMEQTTLAQGDFERTSGGLANQQRIFAAQLENTKASLGTALLPVVTMATKALNTMFSSPEFQAGIANFTAGITGVVNWVTANWPAISAVFQQVWDVVSQGIAFVTDLFTNVLMPGIGGVSTFWEENGAMIIATLQNLWTIVVNVFNTILNVIVSVIGILAPFIKSFLDSILAFWNENGESIMATVKMIWDAVYALFSAAATLIITLVSFLVTNIQAFWTAHGAAIMQIVTTLWQVVATIFTTAIKVVTAIFQGFTALLQGDTDLFAEYMEKAWTILWVKIQEAATVAWAALSKWFQGIVKQIGEFFTKTDWGAIGKGIVDGIWKGLSDGWGWLLDQISGLAQGLLDVVRDVLNIHSPSKAFAQIGANMMLGMQKGIMDNAIKPSLAVSYAAQMAMAPSAAMSAGPSTYYNTSSTNYNLSVNTSQSPQVVTRSFAAMKMLAG